MDLGKYSKYLSSDLYSFLTDLEKATGVEISKLPSTSSAVAGTRYIVKDGDGMIEYYKSSDGSFYALGSSSEEGSKQIELQATDAYIQWKYTDEDEWTDLISVESLKGDDGVNGTDGESAYVYIAYASGEDGTGFTLTFDSSLDYTAILATNESIETPSASDFTGLWKKYKGNDGINGVGVPSGGTTGQVLMKSDETDYNTVWGNVSGGGDASSLNDLSDVDTSNVQNGQALVYDASSSSWKPGTLAVAGIVSYSIGSLAGAAITALSNLSVSITIT